MSETEMKERIRELEKQNDKLIQERNELRNLMTAKIIAGAMTPYQVITSAISNKVYSEVKDTFGKTTRQALKRKIMDDLKWDIHVRYANDFKEEHIEPAKKYIASYEIGKFYKKEEE